MFPQSYRPTQSPPPVGLDELLRQNLELGRTVQLLEEARSHYADHYQYAPVACLTLDGQGCILELNVRAAKLLGGERARLVQMPLLTYIAKESLPGYLAHLRLCQASHEKVVTEVTLGVRGQPARVVELCSVPVVDAPTGRTVYRTALFDVTDYRQTEDALRQSEELFSTAFRANPSAITITSLVEGRYLDVNASFCQLSGYCPSELIGRTPAELHLEVSAAPPVSELSELRQTHTFQNRPCLLRARSGAICELLVSSAIIELAGVECVLTIALDLTERKQLQRELLEISEREQARLGRDLHDGTCQSLAGIAMFADATAQEVGAQDPEQGAKVQKISQLLRQTVVEVRRLASGLYPVALERYGLAWALENLATETAEQWGVQCRFVMPHPILVTDQNIAIHLFRITQAAVCNALRHGRASSILIEFWAAAGTLELRIVDDGRGLPPEPNLKGIGLESMQHRAKMLNGTLELCAGQSRGVIVRCAFPASAGAYAESAADPAEIPPAGARLPAALAPSLVSLLSLLCLQSLEATRAAPPVIFTSL